MKAGEFGESLTEPFDLEQPEPRRIPPERGKINLTKDV